VTVAEALREATVLLNAGSDTARLDAEVLMAHALGVSRSDMLLRAMDRPAPKVFTELVERRSRREPVAYIIGEQEFFGRTFKVSPAVLIPRGDSEVIVEAALEMVAQPNRVIDLGTGSGALLVSVLAERLAAHGIGIDASDAALEIARNNAGLLGAPDRTEFMCRDWCEAGWAEGLGTFDLVLANPPYVEDGAQLDPDVRDHEPASALFAGQDGLDDYRIIIPQLRKLLNEDGAAILEIGHTQALAVTELAQSAGFCVEIRNDLANRPRCAILR
jgi:release factor glutamine methyltransferase